jgi:hypothetical protein
MLPVGLEIFPLPPKLWTTDEKRFEFYRGIVDRQEQGSFYIDLMVCSIFWKYQRMGTGRNPIIYFGILQPIGVGFVVQRDPGFNYLNIGLLIKIENNWNPPEFVSIFPNKGEQGTTLTDVTIIGANTEFESGVDEVWIGPVDLFGIAISNIRTISNTELKLDLEIETDAPIGFRNIRVQYDDGNGSIFAPDAFEVLPKTN